MRYSILLLMLGLGACAQVNLVNPFDQTERPAAAGEVDEASGLPVPTANARTVEQFDTTTEAQRAAAVAPASGGRLLGETVASLGDAATPGFWIETPLVSAVGQGRLDYPANGRSVEVELRPSNGGSSRISLAALRLIEAPLTELVTVRVYAR